MRRILNGFLVKIVSAPYLQFARQIVTTSVFQRNFALSSGWFTRYSFQLFILENFAFNVDCCSIVFVEVASATIQAFVAGKIMLNYSTSYSLLKTQSFCSGLSFLHCLRAATLRYA